MSEQQSNGQSALAGCGSAECAVERPSDGVAGPVLSVAEALLMHERHRRVQCESQLAAAERQIEELRTNRCDMCANRWPIAVTCAKCSRELALLATPGAEVEELRRERDRETEMRRAAEKHNLELRAALDEKPYPDEFDTVLSDMQATALENASLRSACQALEQEMRKHDHYPGNGDLCNINMKSWADKLKALGTQEG